MRKEKDLIGLLQRLVALLSDEANRNPEFASRLDALLSPLPERNPKRTESTKGRPSQDMPDIHAEFSARGEAEFRLWLRDQPVQLLRNLIRQHDLDAARRTRKWKDPEKLSAFISDQIRSRLARGSSFLTTNEPDPRLVD